MQKDKNIRTDVETYKRLKVGASRRSKTMKKHIDDLSKITIKILDEKSNTKRIFTTD